MRTTLVLILVFLFSIPALSQDKPLTQTEYVRLLYSLQKSPANKSDLIDALRRRGIAFQLTDGIRGLTRSKGGNDEELKRALEEAERRRRDPESSRLPSAAETSGFIEKARARALETLE